MKTAWFNARSAHPCSAVVSLRIADPRQKKGQRWHHTPSCFSETSRKQKCTSKPMTVVGYTDLANFNDDNTNISICRRTQERKNTRQQDSFFHGNTIVRRNRKPAVNGWSGRQTRCRDVRRLRMVLRPQAHGGIVRPLGPMNGTLKDLLYERCPNSKAQ